MHFISYDFAVVVCVGWERQTEAEVCAAAAAAACCVYACERRPLCVCGYVFVIVPVSINLCVSLGGCMHMCGCGW